MVVRIIGTWYWSENSAKCAPVESALVLQYLGTEFRTPVLYYRQNLEKPVILPSSGSTAT
jgi:hypothetical protein